MDIYASHLIESIWSIYAAYSFDVDLLLIPSRTHDAIAALRLTNGERAMQEQSSRVATDDQILRVCCVCGLIRDETHAPPDERWVTKQIFRQTHGLDSAAYRLTHTYCPACYTLFMNRIAAT